MKRPTTKVFLDSGDPEETKTVFENLGFLDGQTTNPTLVAKSPEAAARKERGEPFTNDELLAFYRRVVQQISGLIPQGSISIETYADHTTTAKDMFNQARQFNAWIPNAHIKFPTTTEGLKAAQQALAEGIRVNMTLVFSQAQAAAVYAATNGAKRGDVFLSPFIGRLDDIGQQGLDLIKNIQRMYQPGDGHVELLAASIRSTAHLKNILALETDIATAPAKVLLEWVQKPAVSTSASPSLQPITHQALDLNRDWQSFDLHHELTDKGITKFTADWNSLLRATTK